MAFNKQSHYIGVRKVHTMLLFIEAGLLLLDINAQLGNEQQLDGDRKQIASSAVPVHRYCQSPTR